MFSDEKGKFYITAGTIEAHRVRYPERSHFSRLKKQIKFFIVNNDINFINFYAKMFRGVSMKLN